MVDPFDGLLELGDGLYVRLFEDDPELLSEKILLLLVLFELL